jgi:hypothetical protein
MRRDSRALRSSSWQTRPDPSSLPCAGDNIYERVTPQKEIPYFVVGAGGSVRRGDVDRGSGFTATAFDADLTFLAAEVEGDGLVFNTISRAGETVDSGRMTRRK